MSTTADLSYTLIRMKASLPLLALLAITPKAQAQSETTRPSYTTADVHFMQGMIVHHSQALVMTALIPTRTNRNDILLLAKRIEVSQQDEIAGMRRWLESRHQPIDDMATMHEHHDSAGAMKMLMPGMLSAEQLAQLSAAHDAAFDELFLRFMIQHHEGALTMVANLFATTGAGQAGDMYAFASEIEADQRGEIMRMRAMLGFAPLAE